jgi:hypothetical protein
VSDVPDLTLVQVIDTIYPLDDDMMAVIFPKGDTPPHFRHRCHAKRPGAPGGISERISAPSLALHTVVSRDPLTIVASIHCLDCGLHGFVTNGKWKPA